MSMKELIECKHPNAWIEFEMGMISEVYTVPSSKDCTPFFFFFNSKNSIFSEIDLGLRHICIDKLLMLDL